VHLSVRKVAVFAGLPLALLAVFLLMGINGSPKASAAVDPTIDFNISAPGCSSTGTPTAKCDVPIGGTFTVTFAITALPSNGNYDAYGMDIVYAGNVSVVAGSLDQSPWPDCGVPTGEGGFTPGDALTGCTIGLGAPSSTYLGTLATLDFQCGPAAGGGTLTLTPGAGKTETLDSGFNSYTEAASEALNINCNPATDTPTPPPTSTPPPQPRVAKVPAIQNVFLTRQGAKIPPARCEDGTNVANLDETINIPITSQDPKNPSVFQKLGAFQFEARFDDKLVCVSVDAGGAWATNTQVVCSQVAAKGLLRFGCVTTGKNAGLNGPGTLAVLHVRPQEELYSQIRPNQDNGIPVQILNQGCNLADEQGHVIPIFSCEDADITFRFLEGDVSGAAPGGPDCSVDVFDMQTIAFRWGAAKGSLLYSSFMDLSPSGQIKGDGRIDIKDLQFVFGRADSTCAAPHPPQDPVNPKA
jgi:hypothetical protein